MEKYWLNPPEFTPPSTPGTRVYLVHGEVHIDSEICYEKAIFSTWEKAFGFLCPDEDDEWDDIDDDCFVISYKEIIEFRLDDEEPWNEERSWIFRWDGKLMSQHTASEEVGEERAKTEYSAKFGVGDIVYIKPKMQCFASQSARGEYGVVQQCPDTSKDAATEECEQLYIVIFIGNMAITSHYHLPEQALETCDQNADDIPGYLKLYSKHLKGEIELPERLLKDEAEKKVFLWDGMRGYWEYLKGTEFLKEIRAHLLNNP